MQFYLECAIIRVIIEIGKALDMNFSKLPVISDVAFLDMQNRKKPMIAIPGRNFASLSLPVAVVVFIPDPDA